MGDYQKALEAAGAEVHAYESFGSYQGDWWALVTVDGERGWVHGYYGSCSGCDAFEAEFGYDEDRCKRHQYEQPMPNCDQCRGAESAYLTKLADFGRDYLPPITQEAAEQKAAENLAWDSDAQEMLDFIKAHR
jgi:hypothetical protein